MLMPPPFLFPLTRKEQLSHKMHRSHKNQKMEKKISRKDAKPAKNGQIFGVKKAYVLFVLSVAKMRQTKRERPGSLPV
jgi:hypothetical protein